MHVTGTLKNLNLVLCRFLLLLRNISNIYSFVSMMVLFSPTLTPAAQTITSVNRSLAATVEAAVSTQKGRTNATVGRVINTWCCMEDLNAQVQQVDRLTDVVKCH